MFAFASAASQPARLLLRAALVAGSFALGGCATHYLDGAVKDVASNEFARPAQAKAVQVVFEFQTNGAANARATEFVKPLVMESVKSSVLFSDAQDKPVAGGAVLSVKINNVALTDDAFKKGFMTGLTFGIAGSTVTDGYLCTVTYLPSGGTPVVKTAKHAIHTAMGSSGAPPNGVKVDKIDDAVRTMVRQITGMALRDLSHDPAFK
jgi:hypothetical protein